MTAKPIKISPDGRRWTVHVQGVPIVRTADGKLSLDRERAGLKPGKGAGAPPPADAPAERFKTKEDARHAAHMIGRYMMNLGDFVSTYTEGY